MSENMIKKIAHWMMLQDFEQLNAFFKDKTNEFILNIFIDAIENKQVIDNPTEPLLVWSLSMLLQRNSKDMISSTKQKIAFLAATLIGNAWRYNNVCLDNFDSVFTDICHNIRKEMSLSDSDEAVLRANFHLGMGHANEHVFIQAKKDGNLNNIFLTIHNILNTNKALEVISIDTLPGIMKEYIYELSASHAIVLNNILSLAILDDEEVQYITQLRNDVEKYIGNTVLGDYYRHYRAGADMDAYITSQTNPENIEVLRDAHAIVTTELVLSNNLTM